MYTRRDIGRLALASLGPLAHAAGKPDSRINGVLIGAQSYSFRDRPLDAAIQGFVDVGLSECELSMGHVEPEFPRGPEGRAALRKWRLSVPLDDIRAIRHKFDRAGIELSAYAYNMRDDFTDEEIARGFEMARALGVEAMTTSATVSVTPRIAAQAEKYKMVVGMHGHSNVKDTNEYAKPETFVAAMKLSPYIAVNLDIGHYWAAGYDPVPFIEEHHARIVTLHIKDRKKNQGKNMAFGEGDTPIKEVLQLLRREKYPIPANIEYEYAGGDTVAEMRRCYEYCRGALA
ncbi:MAG TPA: sugar phosphate isomerase/epimerase [Bryobacteraceae bacterium]|jgi:sugar phosphate isomerase/epimerase|nr:sugar phosphate isomerase/epimerase [Bryobacteraceae bacterium]